MRIIEAGVHNKRFDPDGFTLEGVHHEPEFTRDELKSLKQIFRADPNKSGSGKRDEYGKKIPDISRRVRMVETFYDNKVANANIVASVKKMLASAPRIKQTGDKRSAPVRNQVGAPKATTSTGRYTTKNRSSLKISGGLN
tara:strand:+ start:1593 stop:2012 length:420 start_codon:yes stop_codon:yes gene_type:complete